MTPQARDAVGGRAEIPMTRFPFNIGRESRADAERSGLWAAVERRLGRASQLNDLYVADWSTPGTVQISHQHCAIVRDGEDFFVLDRNSACGTSVSGHRIGGDRRGGRARLVDGDTLTLGREDSPYVFQFRIATND